MKAKAILAAFFVIATSALAHAGGRPTMFVVVDKVLKDTEKKTPGWIQIWGTFSRTERLVDKAGNVSIGYSKPIHGYIYLSLPKKNDPKIMEELKDWENAAGSGKAVVVGYCGDESCMLTCPIHPTSEKATQPDAEYNTKVLKYLGNGNVYANGNFDNHPEVKALLKFAKERK